MIDTNIKNNLKELSVLYVEDEENVRIPLSMMLKRVVKNVYVAENGEEGLELFKKHFVDVILTDIKMPKMNGLEMAEKIREISQDVPIIFTTAFGDSGYLKEALEIGVDGYIIKPVNRDRLFKKLNLIATNILNKKEVEIYTKLIQTIFNNQKDGLALFDKNYNIKIFNKAFKTIIKKEPTTLFDLIEFCKDENGNKITIELFEEYIQNGGKVICQTDNLNKIQYFETDIQKVENYIILNLKDITKYKLETEEIKDKAMIDELTNVYNRKKFELLSYEYIGNDVCIIMFDIDDFKKINDTYGHLKGDEVLKELAFTIKENIRENSDTLIRWGGEEFVVILNNLNDIEIAEKLAEKFRIAVNHINIPEVGHFSCSFGVSCGFVKGKCDIKEILNNADKALYRAKRNGKNRVEIF
jgi:diguanylate cyclase (GGDEF)-like protein